jgi:hypothetical protein
MRAVTRPILHNVADMEKYGKSGSPFSWRMMVFYLFDILLNMLYFIGGIGFS